MSPTQAPAPARRFWHRYAVLETSLKTGDTRVDSWHFRRSAALLRVADLICTYQGNVLPGDWFDWRPLPASHPLVLLSMREGRKPVRA